MAVAHNALAAILGLEISMLGEKIRDLGLDRLRQQRARPLPQDFGELIVKASWLNQLEHVIVRHGISLLRWRSGGVKHPHDMPPFRFLPSPTFSDSSSQEQITRSVDQIAPSVAANQEQMTRSIDRIAASQEEMARGINRLTTGQEQMTREITKLQEIAQYALYKNSEPPVQPATPPARKPVPRSSQAPTALTPARNP